VKTDKLMKEKLIELTKNLFNAGFAIEGLNIESNDLVIINFNGLNGLELIINNCNAKIKKGKCSKEKYLKIKEIVESLYTIKENLEPEETDMFTDLLNANLQ